jgi:hypothetical protein
MPFHRIYIYIHRQLSLARVVDIVPLVPGDVHVDSLISSPDHTFTATGNLCTS